MTETRELMEGCAEAARRGGAVLLEKWGQARTIAFKGGIDLVTDADTASEEALLGFLRGRFPGAALLAEESGAQGAQRGLRFVVDPLDGTTNYAHGVPQFAVNVAALDDRGIVAGATLDPIRGELFLAGRGEGAWLGQERIRPSGCEELRRALLVTGFPYDIHSNHERPLRLFGEYVRRAQAVRRFGAAALDLAWVACGRFDGFWELRLKPWDIAPGILLVREAGGLVTDLEGGDRMLETGDVVAAPPALHPLLVEVAKGAG
ncbi:MAG TPA: inositol monophosphatase family protein [Anaeromyxobacteraceae bacterium]|nr:inositol monophosphatase family protein [Anaeromyxobacteraceae bacterium]